MNEVVLRAMSVGELLDKAFRIYRSKFALLIGIVAVVMIPESVVRLLLILFLSPQYLQLNVLVSSFFQIFATLALIVCISHTYLEKPITLRDSYSLGLSRFWSVFGANFIIGAVVGIPMAILIFIPIAGACLIFLYIPVVIFLSTRWALAAPSIVTEDIGSSEGLRRSWNLTDGHFWRVTGTSLAASLLTILITTLPTVFFSYLFTALNLDFQIIQIFNLFIEQAATTIALPFSIAATVLIYYDLRIRKEGFDLQVLADASNAPIVSAE
jgi:hypothetical protein